MRRSGTAEVGWLVDGELPYLHVRGRELSGLVLGLVGYGAVGQRHAQRPRRLRMPVLFTDPQHEGGVPGAALDVFATEPLPHDSPLLPAAAP